LPGQNTKKCHPFRVKRMPRIFDATIIPPLTGLHILLTILNDYYWIYFKNLDFLNPEGMKLLVCRACVNAKG